MSDKLTMDVHRLLTMCNYYHAITNDDKDFLALLAERLERYDGELTEVLDKIEELVEIGLTQMDKERSLKRELAEARRQRDTLVEALSMYGLPHSDDDLEHIAQNPSPYTEIGIHEAKRELIRRKTLAAVKGGEA